MWRLWCEWDIGQEDLVFEDAGLAEEWAVEALNNQGIEENYDTLFDEGFIGTEKLLFIKRIQEDGN